MSLSTEQVARIIALAQQSAVARYNWKNQGRAPIGYTKGMAIAYGVVYAKLKYGEAAAVAMAAPITSPGGDVLAWYAEQIGDAGMRAAPRLRVLFAIMLGLGMRESSGRYCEGRDKSADNEGSDNAEAGLFQTSWDIKPASQVLFGKLFAEFSADAGDGLLPIFREGVTPRPGDLTNYGSGDGRRFQELSKAKPLFAVEFAAVGLRCAGGGKGHWGPIRRHEAELRPEAGELFRQVEAIVDASAEVHPPAEPPLPPAEAPTAPVPLQGGYSLATEPQIRAVQALLVDCGYLDPPADGFAGRMTALAVKMAGGIEALSTLKPLPLHPGEDFAGRVVRAMQKRGDWISRHPQTFNVAYVEGTEFDGRENDNRPNAFCDRRLVIQVRADGVPIIVGNWDATTEPSRHWTLQPMHPLGAFHINLGQQKSWVRGLHHGRDAWVQARVIEGTRDPDKTFKRDPRHPWRGDDMGVNQHMGYNLPHDDMGNSSAGCLVGRLDEGHDEFMRITTSDARYRANPSYVLMTSVLPQLSTMGV